MFFFCALIGLTTFQHNHNPKNCLPDNGDHPVLSDALEHLDCIEAFDGIDALEPFDGQEPLDGLEGPHPSAFSE